MKDSNIKFTFEGQVFIDQFLYAMTMQLGIIKYSCLYRILVEEDTLTLHLLAFPIPCIFLLH